jgi:inosine/xanthosine triphosphate pyrophosphatase family protein
MEGLRAKDPASSSIIVIATRNAGKVREIAAILDSWPLTFLSLR